MIGVGSLGREQGEHEIDALTVRSFKVHWLVEPGEHTEDAFQTFNAGMRNRDTIAHCGRAQFLAGNQSIDDGPAMEPVEIRRLVRNLLQYLLFTGRLD